jgi:SNF2 family DNA or RNA helicase
VDVLQRRINAKLVTVDGTMTDRQKHAAVRQFQEDPETRVCVCSRAGWRAINLQSANMSGILEFYWRPSDFLQLEGRTYRIGQKAVKRYRYFVAAGTIEERICEILQDKQEVVSAVLDGGTTPEDLNVYELLLNELQLRL